MDAPPHTFNDNEIAKITLDTDLVIGPAINDKIFADAYGYQTNQTNNLQPLNGMFAKETLPYLTQQLLLETIYIAALARYYENLYCYQSRFALSPYSGQCLEYLPEQYPQYYPEQRPEYLPEQHPQYYPEQCPEYLPEQYPQYYPEQQPQYYLRQYFPELWSENLVRHSHHLRHHFGQYLGHWFRHHSSTSSNLFNHLGNHSSHLSNDLSRTISYNCLPVPLNEVHLSPQGSLTHNVISLARHNLGRPIWAFSKFASFCQHGYLGCAATVSELLQHAGLRMNGSASVVGVINELSNLGWHKIKIYDKHQFQAGDIVYGLKGSHAHIGIITAADNDKVLVCDNSSSSGTLKERSIESGGSFTPNGRFAGSLYVMRAHDT